MVVIEKQALRIAERSGERCGAPVLIAGLIVGIGVVALIAVLNIVGLKRRGASRDTIHALRGVYRVLFHGAGLFEERLAEVTESHGHLSEVKRILDFIAAGEKRPLCLPRPA